MPDCNDQLRRYCYLLLLLPCLWSRYIYLQWFLYFFGEFLAQTMSVINLPWKFFSKIRRSESTLNCRSRAQYQWYEKLNVKKLQKKYDSHTNTTMLSGRLCVCFACCLCLVLSSLFVNAAAAKTVISIFLNLWIPKSRCMNQPYFECYEFDINVVLILIATYT